MHENLALVLLDTTEAMSTAPMQDVVLTILEVNETRGATLGACYDTRVYVRLIVLCLVAGIRRRTVLEDAKWGAASGKKF